MKQSKKLNKRSRSKKKWFGIKTLYLIYEKAKGRNVPVAGEERITLFKAANFDEAIRLAEIEAKKYAAGTFENASDNQIQIRYLNACDAFELFDSNITQGTEAYSHMSAVSPKITKAELRKITFGK